MRNHTTSLRYQSITHIRTKNPDSRFKDISSDEQIQTAHQQKPKNHIRKVTIFDNTPDIMNIIIIHVLHTTHN